jgi:hypothetical protein
MQPSLGAFIALPLEGLAWIAAPSWGAIAPLVRQHPGWHLPAPPSHGQLLDGPRPHFCGLGPQNP